VQSALLYDRPRVVVGVAGDVRQNRFDLASSAQMYIPRAQVPPSMDMTLSFDVLVATFIVRTSGDPASLARSLDAPSPKWIRTLR